MSDLPVGWEWTTLQEIAEVQLGRQRSPKNHTGTHMRPYLRAANVGWEGLKLDDVKTMNFTDSELCTFRLLPDDILLTEASGSPSEVGKSAIWKDEIADCCLQNTLIRVRAIGVDASYLLHFLGFEARRGAFVEGARGVGIYHIGATRLSKWLVPVPPIAEQRRIVAALEAQLASLEGGCDALVRAKAHQALLRDSELSRILERGGWPNDVRGLGDYVLEARYGTSIKCSYDGSGPAVLRIPNVQRGSTDLSDLKYVDSAVSTEKLPLVSRGDLLVVRTNGARGLIGRSAVSLGADQLAYASYLIRLRFNASDLRAEWVRLCFESPEVRRVIEDSAASSAGQYNLSVAKLKSLQIPVPEISVQESFLARFQEFEHRVDRTSTDLNRLHRTASSLRGSVLGEAFAGRLVPQDPNDEPASVLLESIRAERAAQPKKGKGRRT